MKKLYVLLLLGIFSFYFGQNKIKKDLSYQFYENKGQVIDQNGKENSAVKYLYNSSGLNVQLKNSGFSYDVYEVKRTLKKESDAKKNDVLIKDKSKPQYDLKYQYHRVDIDFVGANKNPEIIAVGRSNDYDNYYNIPNKPKGVEKVYRYQKIIYKNLYPNVDLAFFKPEDTLKPIEYNFIINPGGKISDIKLKFKGAKTQLKDGKLAMNLRFGEMQENIPNSWIEDLNSKKDIKINFKETGNQEFGFESSQDVFDKTMVIDPVPTRIWGSYFGGEGFESTKGIKTDFDNDILVFGTTGSRTNIATTGAYQSNLTNNYSAFISKIDKNSNKVWGSYITYEINAIDVTQNAIYLGGELNGNGLFFKFNKDGTFLKNEISDGLGGIIVTAISAAEDGIYFSGNTSSPDKIATGGSFQNSNPNYNNLGFIIKKDFDLNTIWGTYFGGDEITQVLNSSVDKNNNIQIYGQTRSKNLPLKNAFQSTTGGNDDGFYANFTKDGNLIQSSYLGFGETDYLYNGKLTEDNKLILIGVFDLGFNDFADGIINVDLNSNVVTTKKFHQYKLGYGSSKVAYSSFIDVQNNIFLTSILNGRKQIATTNAYADTPFSNNPYLMKLESKGEILWATNYGRINSGYDGCFVTLDSNLNIFISGDTLAKNVGTDISTNGTENGGGWDSYIAKFKDCNSSIKVSANSPVCPNSEINLKASGGTKYLWTGPNGYTSTDQNPTIPNAKTINSGTYSCIISGTGDCDGTFTVDVKVEDKTAPVPTIANLPDISGNCKTVVSIVPTAIDACAGNISATTNSPLQYSVPGTYVIVWKYDDGHGNISTQNQNVIISSPALPTANAAQEFCSTENRRVGDLQSSGQNVKWYDANGNLLDQNFKLVEGNYFATQTLNGCESDKIKISVKINVTPLPTGNVNQDFCSSQNAEISDLKVTGANLRFYDLTGNPLANSVVLQDNTSYFVTQSINSCESEKLEIKVVISQNALPANNYIFSICNGTTSTTKTEDLTNYQENLIANSSTYIFEYFDQNQNAISDFKNRALLLGQNVFNVKVSTAEGCFKTVQLTLQLNEKPEVNLPETAEFCTGKSVELDAGFNPNYTYEWSSGEKANKISVNKEGTYTLTVTTNFGCQNTASTMVKKSLIAEILSVDITNNNAKIILSASGDFEYSLDNKNWQDSNEFKNLANGNYTVYVRTKLGCIIGEKDFTIFNISNSFSPNGDGKNDIWKVDGLENYPNSEVSVYDNQGKRVLFKITSGAFEWDGKLNSRNLPTATYWYNIKVSDGRILNGYLLLKNRN